MTPAEMAKEGRRLTGLLEAALASVPERVRAAATAERDYRKAVQEAWVRCPRDEKGVKAGDKDWPVSRREAWVDAETSDLRYVRDVAEGMLRNAYGAQRAYETQISLLQSTANVYKAEAQFAQFGPDAA